MKPQGNTAIAALVSVGIVGASIAVFFVYTKDKIEPEDQDPRPPAQVAEVPSNVPADPVTPPGTPTTPVTPGTPVAPDPATVVAGTRFDTAGALAEKIGNEILKGDFKGAAGLISGQEEGAARFVEAEGALGLIFTERALKADSKGFGEIGQTGTAQRFGLALAKGDGSEAGRIVIDLVKDEKRGWKVETIEVPKEIAAELAKLELIPKVGHPTDPEAAGTPGTGEEKPKGLVVEERPEDALAAAESFVAALMGQDYEAARETADFERVSSEKIAGLCIVFEEGKYRMRKSKPLITTAAQADSAWVIARLEHLNGENPAEFGIELEKDGGNWKVVALNLSKLLASFTEESDADGVAYAPMVSTPQGGQSIALYFEFDDGSIHPRAARQLEIISKVLKGDASKSLKITGHTDELGGVDYNVKLSKERAANVKTRLLELGVNVAQIITVGAGESLPLRPNVREDGSDDPEARSHNRRAEIFLDF